MRADPPAAPLAQSSAPGRVQRWGIVGLGARADAIATKLRAVPGVVLAGCAGSSWARTADFGRRHNCRAYHGESALFSGGFDVVAVASANARHAEQTVAALRGGSAVLCEKPLTVSVDDADQVLATAVAVNRPVFVGHHLRFQALTREIREVVASGELGEIRDIYLQRYSEQVSAHVHPWRRDLTQAGAGVLCDVAVHLFDYLTWITGLPVTTVGAVATPPRKHGKPDEHVVVSLELAGGALAVVDAARSLPCGDNGLHIHGSQGSLCTGPLRWTDDFRAEIRSASGNARTVRAAATDPLLAELIAVRDARNGRPSEPLATGEEGRRGVAILEAAIRSIETGHRSAPREDGTRPGPQPADHRRGHCQPGSGEPGPA